MRAISLSILAVFALAGLLPAQSPKSVIVSAAPPAVTSPQAPADPDTTASIEGALKMLREMKAANEEMLQKQAATLAQLDELEKAVDQLKIFSKRG